jgi:hypothetical protein
MTKDEINVSLFDECQSRAIRIDELERELREARELIKLLIKNNIEPINDTQIFTRCKKLLESEAGDD